MPIVAILISVVILLGGLFPNIANGVLHQQLDKILNHPQSLKVRLYPESPSFSIIDGAIAYLEVEAHQFTLQELPIERLVLKLDKTKLDGAQMRNKELSLEYPTWAYLEMEFTQKGFNQFLASKKMEGILDGIQKQYQEKLPIDASLADLSVDLQQDKVFLKGNAQTLGGFFTIPFRLSSVFRLNSEQELYAHDVSLFNLSQYMSDEMLKDLLKQINPLVDLKRFSNQDMQIYFREFTVNQGKLLLKGEINFFQIPAMK